VAETTPAAEIVGVVTSNIFVVPAALYIANLQVPLDLFVLARKLILFAVIFEGSLTRHATIDVAPGIGTSVELSQGYAGSGQTVREEGVKPSTVPATRSAAPTVPSVIFAPEILLAPPPEKNGIYLLSVIF
jgi:hypothetical protein